MASPRLDVILLVQCIVLFNPAVFGISNNKKVILFMLDGFRWDYFDPFNITNELPGFERFFRDGVKADYIVPTYPTKSYPNYYSIMTGRYPENHGFVGNFMYDEEHNEKFLIGTNKEQYHAYWWEGAEPLWITAEKQNLRTAWYYWPGTEVTIFGRNSTHVTPYTRPPTMDELEAAIHSGIRDIVERSISVVGIYVEEMDKTGHRYGPGSDKVLQAIRDIDAKLTILMNKLETIKLTQHVNVLIFSDHGMTSQSTEKVVDLREAIDEEDIKVNFVQGSYAQIWPKEGKLDKVFNGLNNFHPHVHVYKKEDLPDRYHLKNHKRTAPIILTADLQWTMIIKQPAPNRPLDRGGHGFDNEEMDMRGIFMALGPGFKKNYRAKPFVNISIYKLMCHLLKITPATNDGNWKDVDTMLVDSNSASSLSKTVILWIFMLDVIWLLLK